MPRTLRVVRSATPRAQPRRRGVKYTRFLADEYFDEPGIDPLNRALFGFAA